MNIRQLAFYERLYVYVFNSVLLEAHFGRPLRIAEELRSEADYPIIRQISDEEADANVDDAEMFLARARDLIVEIKKGR